MKRQNDNAAAIIAKVLMSAVYLWSGFFWSGVTVYNFAVLNTEYSYLAKEFVVGSALLLAALLLCWFRLYIIQFAPAVAGIIVFLIPAREMIQHVEGTGVYFKPSFEARYLPIIVFGVLSAALLIGRIWNIFSTHAEARERFNDQPTESVLDKHKE